MVTGGWPQAVAVADVTDDGRADVLMTVQDGRVLVFAQDEAGGLATPVNLGSHWAWGSALSLAVGDLNGDSKTDAAVTVESGIDVYYQSGGTLSAPVLISFAGPRYVEVADLDGDSLDDLVVSTATGIRALHNEGDGSFTSSAIASEGQTGFAVGDVTGDAGLDVVSFVWLTVNVYAQLADGSFAAPLSYAGAAPFGAEDIAVGDLTGDSRNDVVLSFGGNSPSSRLNVFAQTESGTLAAPLVHSSYDSPKTISVGDVDGDSRDDVVAVHTGWLQAGLYLQAEDGTLGQECLYPIPYLVTEQQGLALGDIDGDGRVDMLFADYGGGLGIRRQLDPATQGATISLDAARERVELSKPVRLSGTVAFPLGGCRSEQSVRLVRTNPDGSETDVGTATADVTGAFQFEDEPAAPGVYVYRAMWDGDGTRPASSSPERTVDVLGLPTTLALETSKRRVSYRGAVTVTATLGPHHAGAVSIYATPRDGERRLLRSDEPNDAGKLSVRLRLLKTTAFVAEFSGDDLYRAVTSPRRDVAVSVIVAARMVDADGHSGPYALYDYTQRCTSRGAGCPTFAVHVTPDHAGKPVDVTLQVRVGGRWVTALRDRLRLNDQSNARVAFIYANANIIGYASRARARFPGDGDHASDTSPWRYFEVV